MAAATAPLTRPLGAEWLATGVAVLLIAETILFGVNGAVFATGAALLHVLLFLTVFLRPSALGGGWRALAGHLARTPVTALLFLAVLGLCTASILPRVGGAAFGWSVDRQATLVELVKLAGFGCLFLVGVEIGHRRDARRTFLAALQGLALLFALYALVQFMVWPDAWSAEGRYAAAGRLSANFGSANTTAALLGAILLLGLPGVMSRLSAAAAGSMPGALVQAFNLRTATALALIGALMLTQSRAAVAITAALIVVFVVWDRVVRRGRIGGAVLVVAAGAAAAALLGGDLVLGRFAQSRADLDARAVMVSTHMTMVHARPWLGYGLGAFDTLNLRLLTPDNFSVLFNIGAVHNVYVQWLEGAGGVGAGLMFGAIGLLLVRLAVFVLRGAGGRQLRVAAAVLCASLLFVMHGAVDYDLEVPSIAATWSVVLGVGIGATAQRTPQRRRRLRARSSRSAPDRMEVLDHDFRDAVAG